MTVRPNLLPEFENPPVIEVVLGVQFERLALRTVDTGRLWEAFRADFPNVQEHPPLEPSFEMFGTTRAGAGGVRLELMHGPLPLPRLWFVNAEGTELLQLQADRLIHNWRKAGDSASYPRYEAIKDSYLAELARFEAFLAEIGQGPLRCNQCEVTYVNHIVSTDDENLCATPEQVLKLLAPANSGGRLPPLESARCQWSFVLQADDGRPIGRLHANAQPATSRDGRAMIALTMTARGTPKGPTTTEAAAFIDIGRAAVVHGFAAVTTETMHARWRRTQ